MEDTTMFAQDSLTDNQSEMVVCYQIIEEYPDESEIETEEYPQTIEEILNMDSNTVAGEQIIDIGPHVAEIDKTPRVLNGPRPCPICSSTVIYFLLNFDVGVYVCLNHKCEYPIGYEDLQFENYKYVDYKSFKIDMQKRCQYSDSMNSSAARLDVEKTNNVACEDKFKNQFLVPKSVKPISSIEGIRKKKMSDIKKNLEFLKKGNMELHEMANEKSLILNESWVKKLKHLQDKSGVTLLKPEELKCIQVKKDNGVKIDIDKGDGNNMCTIKILMDPPSTSSA